MMKVTKHNFDADGWIAKGRVGEALNGMLREVPSENYCPSTVQKVLEDIVRGSYLNGYKQAMDDFQNGIFDMRLNFDKQVEEIKE